MEIEGPPVPASVSAQRSTRCTPSQTSGRSRKSFRDIRGARYNPSAHTPAAPATVEQEREACVDDEDGDNVDVDVEEAEDLNAAAASPPVCSNCVAAAVEVGGTGEDDIRSGCGTPPPVERHVQVEALGEPADISPHVSRAGLGRRASSEAPCEGGWQLHKYPAAVVSDKPPGTFYTIEVLCPDPPRQETGGVSEREAFRACVESDARGVVRNEAVVHARCRGWGMAQLSLIPLSALELEEQTQLVQGGIPRFAYADPAAEPAERPCPPLSTTPLPDRDAPEEYAAWYTEVQDLCRQGGISVSAC